MAAIARLSSRLCGIVNTRIPKNFLPALITAPSHSEKLITFTPTACINTFVPWIPKANTEIQSVVEAITEAEEKLTNEIVGEINNRITQNSTSRLFAVVHLCGKQYKITENDLIIVQGYWPPNTGDKLNLEKVMMVGGTDFTLVGRPILNRESVNIEATIIEKTMSHTRTHFRYKKRKQFRRIHFRRSEHTVIRINSIKINRPINELKEVEGLDRVY